MSQQRPTEICITIDTEFSIAGHFQKPEAYQPVAEPLVYGTVDGRDQGLGFMLDTFERFGTAATFFVECANYYYFGDQPMQAVVKRIADAGQDVQLHVHPVWLSFLENGGFARNDDCAGRSYEDLYSIFSECIAVFKRWTGRHPDALRTGSLRADDTVYRVLADLGIPLTSNIGLGIFQPPQQHLQLHAGRHRIHGVTEVPVFTYQDMRIGAHRARKSLQITSCSWPEMRHLLKKARANGVETIVLLTHPFEFIKASDFRYSRIRRNRINQQRLSNLCQFIHDNPADFAAVDFAGRREEWLGSELQQPFIAVPSHYAIGRKLHNRLNDLVWSY